MIRKKRLTTQPKRFDPEQMIKAKTPASEVVTMRQELKLAKENLKTLTEGMKTLAHEFTCPLLCLEQGVSFPRHTNCLKVLLLTKMTTVAVAGDGYKYDLHALQRYIKKNFNKRLVSPITGKPMTAVARYFVKTKNSGRVEVWMPGLSQLG